MSRSFSHAAAIGAVGEELAAQTLLPSLFPDTVIQPIQPTDQKWLHADFIVHGPDRVLVEVKYDTHKTGNLALETALHYTSGRIVPGWLYRSKADIVLYILAQFQEAYVIDLAHLRWYITQQSLPLKHTELAGQYKAYFYLLHRDLAVQQYPVITYGTDR